MTQLTIQRIADRVQTICDANNSWYGDLNKARNLYTLGGDWAAEVEWMTDWLIEDYNGGGHDFFEAGVHLAVTQNPIKLEDMEFSFALGEPETIELIKEHIEDNDQFKLNYIVAAIDYGLLDDEEPATVKELLTWALAQGEDKYLLDFYNSYIVDFEDDFTEEEFEAAEAYVYENGVGKQLDNFKAAITAETTEMEAAELFEQTALSFFAGGEYSHYNIHTDARRVAWTTYIQGRLDSATSPVGQKLFSAVDGETYAKLFEGIAQKGKWQYDANGNYVKAA